MTWKIKWEELDGEDIGKDKRKKRLNVVGCSSGNNRGKLKSDLLEQSEVLLLRSNSRVSIGSDKVIFKNKRKNYYFLIKIFLSRLKT